MNHYLVYFKYCKTYDIIPKDRIAGPATVGETVVVPYSGGKKYKAIIKHSGSKGECEKRAEDSFVTASVSSTAILHSGPSSLPP
uniref:MSP domain-containing protein n=1 Tax=Heterorhabditis bacteriophora TaxID=37862 RepID=A0A1I7XCP0_HETBA